MMDLKVEDPAKDREARTVAQKPVGPQLDEAKHDTPLPVHAAPLPLTTRQSTSPWSPANRVTR